MDRVSSAGQSLETDQLRQLAADDRLILREDGALIRDDDDAWGDVEIVDLEDEVPSAGLEDEVDTIDIDLDDACVLRVEEVVPAPTAGRVGRSPPPPRAAGPPEAPTMSTPTAPVVRGRPIARIRPVRDPKRDVLRAIVAGDFASAQQALGHGPKPRVASKPEPRRKPDK